MKINKDNVVGAVVMLLIIAIAVWGWMITAKLDRVARAHDNLVGLMSPVIQQIQQANAMQRPRASSAVPAAPAPREEQPKAAK